jgi:diguanylate cyclase (GGDEF)-like protein
VDILLLDIKLPDGDGMELCREVMSNNDQYGDVRVVFMTGLTSADDEVRGLNLGASDYIHKPINSAVLFARVRLQAQLIRRNELLANLARIDGLTEIPNRRAFDTQLSNEWSRAKREESSLVLAIVDIDHFKLFNDHYGHPEGDKCLHAVAQFFTKTFKRGSDFVARYGGEEFAILLSGLDLNTAMQLFEKAQRDIEALGILHEVSPTKPTVSFSAGLCYTAPNSSSPDGFLAQADQQLYKAKKLGRAQTQGNLFLSDQTR